MAGLPSVRSAGGLEPAPSRSGAVAVPGAWDVRRRACVRSSSATVLPVVTGSSGCIRVASTSAYAASQRSAARAITTQVGRASSRLVLELPGDAEAAGRARLAVEHQQVDLVVVDQPDALAVGRRLDELDLQVGRGPGADGQPHPVPDLRVVAVEQDGAKTIASCRERAPPRSCPLIVPVARDVADIPPGVVRRGVPSGRLRRARRRRRARGPPGGPARGRPGGPPARTARIHCTTSTASMVTLTNSPPAHRMPPATTWSCHGSAQARSSDGYQSPPSSVAALHDGQPEHGVERHGQEHQQRPRRVRPAAGQRVEAEQRPEEQAADR